MPSYELRKARVPYTELESNYIFFNGTWWRIKSALLRHLALQECTAQEAATKIIGHPGIVILEKKQEAPVEVNVPGHRTIYAASLLDAVTHIQQVLDAEKQA